MKKRTEKQQDLDKLKTEPCQSLDRHSLDVSGHHGRGRHKLRRAVQAAGGKYKVVKNTLAERAGAGTPAENLLKNLSGTNSIAYTRPTRFALAKALTKVLRTFRRFQFKSGVVEGRVISIAEIQQLASLPSKEELISKIMFLAERASTAHRHGSERLPRNLAVTVSEAIKAKKFGSGGEGAAPSAEPAPVAQ